jgi:alginate O-acetyltransferase complex protein AlgI
VVFTEPTFLFLFLPVVLGLYFGLRKPCRNALLTVVSVFFYTLGEPDLVALLLTSCLLNHACARRLEQMDDGRKRRILLGVCIAGNLAALGIFKYLNFAVESLNVLLTAAGADAIALRRIHLPLGISFYTFHALSYVIDVYRREVRAAKSPTSAMLYLSLFPQLVAGPIVRYHDLAPQIAERAVRLEDFAAGIRRFIVGLGKKMIIANTVARPADALFSLPTADLTAGLAWLGILCYAIQIYFDFSGSSDMAIGLGRMFGFRFRENFNYPYAAGSITDFWRRWHISLSTWFRDYLYIPLGGSRMAPLGVYRNLLIVFLLCGLWHGASWNFVVWGLFHGGFLVLERLGVLKGITARPGPLRHFYVLLVVAVGWVFFRAETLTAAFGFLAAMAGFGSGAAQQVRFFLDPVALGAILIGVVGSAPIVPWLQTKSQRWKEFRGASLVQGVFELGSLAGLLVVLFVSITLSAAGTYNPFIYFRF